MLKAPKGGKVITQNREGETLSKQTMGEFAYSIRSSAAKPQCSVQIVHKQRNEAAPTREHVA